MKKPLRLTRRVNPRSIHDPPSAIALEREETKMAKQNQDKHMVYELVEVDSDVFGYPFPLSAESQKKLLNLIHTRKSGIITRLELEELIYSEVRIIN